MQRQLLFRSWIIFALAATLLRAQDPTGAFEGQILDKQGGTIAEAALSITNLQTGYTRSQTSSENGFFRFSLLPIGNYSLSVKSNHFAPFTQQPIGIAVSEISRLDVHLELASVVESVSVTGGADLVDTATNTLGKVVSGREVVDLPLNGRNFSQLGLLQTGVAPLTAGLSKVGGSLRADEAFVVNGQRPESNNYLLDGSQNVDRLDGAYALKIPVDAIAEFRMLTHTAPPEYGGNSGSTTSVVTKAGGNGFHGTVYEFFRNNALDTRNFYSQSVEPLKQNQYGATVGGPIKKDRLFFFAYYEGFRNRQGVTQSATVPTAAERSGDFSGLGSPLINYAAGGTKPFPNNTIPTSLFNPTALNVIKLYPLGNVSPSVYTTTLVGQNDADQAGGRLDFNRTEKDQLFARYSYSTGNNLNPISVRGAPLPGFPVRDDLTAHSAVLSDTHLWSASRSNSARVSFFRYLFDFDQRLNRDSPASLGFGYNSASALGQGPPYFNLSGYSPIGGAQSGPRLSAQNTYEAQDGVTWIRGSHSFKFGAEFRRNQINVFQATVPNGLFIFSSSFPLSDAFANLLTGSPVLFYQGLGDFYRGLRNWGTAVYAQDEWRVSRRLTLNYGLRHEIINPYSEIRNRLDGFIPGAQSVRMPNAPAGIVFPGDAGVSAGIAADYYAGWMPRLGIAWDPTGNGLWSIRSSYGIFYDPFGNGANTLSSPAVSSLPWAQFDQISGQVPFTNPFAGRPAPQLNAFSLPSTLLAVDPTARPPYAQDWNFSIQRSLHKNYLLEVRYVGTKGSRLPRNIEANPAIYGPGATSANADRRRVYANCQPNNGPCQLATVAVTSYGSNSTYESGQVSLSRRFGNSFGFNLSYWYSKTLDYLSAMNLNTASATPLAGENDLAQNPFDLRAEHGPSLFDATHRFVASGSWELPFARTSHGVKQALLQGWQLNSIASANSGTPFTVYDSSNVALQASSPPISGYFASRPNLIGDPNAGPHNPNSWLARSSFLRLNPLTQAGQFGNAGRNIARGPGFADVDVSLMKNFRVRESATLQFRAESFNVANHPNFGLPISDLASSDFGRILSAGPARLTQFALKILF